MVNNLKKIQKFISNQNRILVNFLKSIGEIDEPNTFLWNVGVSSVNHVSSYWIEFLSKNISKIIQKFCGFVPKIHFIDVHRYFIQSMEYKKFTFHAINSEKLRINRDTRKMSIPSTWTKQIEKRGYVKPMYWIRQRFCDGALCAINSIWHFTTSHFFHQLNAFNSNWVVALVFVPNDYYSRLIWFQRDRNLFFVLPMINPFERAK